MAKPEYGRGFQATHVQKPDITQGCWGLVADITDIAWDTSTNNEYGSQCMAWHVCT